MTGVTDILDGTAEFPTVFNSETCVRKGLCPVTQIRGQSTFESHSIYYEQHGTGPERVVFIMGLKQTSAAWIRSVPHFTNDERYSVLVFDNRGIGNSTIPRGPYTTEGMAEDIVVLLNYIGWKETHSLHIVGASLGGMLAQELALKIPERIVTLCLVVTTPGGRPWENFLTVPTWEGTKTILSVPFIRDGEKKINSLLGLLYSPIWLDQRAENDHDQTNRQMVLERIRNQPQPPSKPGAFVGGLSQLWAGLTHRVTPDQLQYLARVIPKVLIVTGDDDNIVNSKNSLRMKKDMKGAELVVWGNAGHGLGIQHADRFNALLERAFAEGRTSLAIA